MTNDTTCALCGWEFEATGPGRGRPRKFCPDCRDVAQWMARKGRFLCSVCGRQCHGAVCQRCSPRRPALAARPENQTKCNHCGKPLTVEQVKRGGRFCGIVCNNRASGIARSAVKSGKSSRPCEWCGQQFKPTSSQPRRPQRFCSKACRGQWQRSKSPKSSRVYPRRCDGCSRWFVARSNRTKCCSKECGYQVWYAKSYQKQPTPPDAQCLQCGKTFIPATKRNVYCSGRCSSRAARDRRTARKRGAYVADVWRARIFERDGYCCQLCGKRLAMDKKAPHPKSPSIDHIVPISLGGTHEPANVQAAHFGCNSRKGNGSAPNGDQLLLIG